MAECMIEDKWLDLRLIPHIWGYEAYSIEDDNKLGFIEVNNTYFKVYRSNGKLITITSTDKLTMEQIKEYYNEESN